MLVSSLLDSDDEVGGLATNPKCMTTEWSEFSECSVTCGVGVKTRYSHLICKPCNNNS